MFRNYCKVAIRSLWRFKTFSFINLFGLAIGMIVCLTVVIFVRYEMGYDRQYDKNIYRLCEIQQQEQDAAPAKIAQTRFPVAPALKAEIPGIRDFTRIISWEKVPMTTMSQANTTATTFGTDASFFRLFGISLLSGDTGTALKEPGGLVLTQTLARRLFGNTNPMGQTVRFERRDTLLFHVTGIMQDVPQQSHFQFEALYALSTEERPDWMINWTASWAFTYIRLEKNVNVKTMEAAFPAFLQKHIGKQTAAGFRLFLQPLRDIHLYSADITHDLLNGQKFDGDYIPLLVAVALFVLILGMINYINLSTARLLARAKEVGIRKVNGAGRMQIALQFLSETLIFSFIALVVAIILTLLLLPFLADLLQRNFDPLIFLDPLILIIVTSMIIVTGGMAGLLPAIAMASIKPVPILKGNLWTSYRSPLRNALVVAQFTIATGLSMAALTIHRQLKFVQQYDAGFDKEAVVVIPVGYADRQKEEGLMQQLNQVRGVKDVTGALRRLGGSIDLNEVVFNGDRQQQSFRCATMFVDFNYIPFYRIELLAGRNFSSAFGGDRNGQSYIINETMARELMVSSLSRDTSFNALIGKPFRYGFEDSMGSIIAITRDFNFNSLHQRVEPLCMTYLHDYFFTDLSIRLNTGATNETITRVEKIWKEVFPGQQFSWHYLDSSLQELYKSDIQAGAFMKIFTVIAFCISCLGLIGVTTFTIERRTKEIGVRKVLGATVQDIVLLLSKDFAKLVLAGICIALPAAGWWMNSWLEGYAYHTNILWWMFALTGIISLVVAMVTVCLQSAKAAYANPVNSIKQE
ncbi:MAG TPA: ABC transporter permease [Puia sp.]